MRNFKINDYVVIVNDEDHKYGHRIPIGTITKIIYVSPHYNSPFPYITQHSMREVRDSEIRKIYSHKELNKMWIDDEFKILEIPTLEDYRKEFHDDITPRDELSGYGLIDRKGNFYKCAFGGHGALASIICDYSYDDRLIEEYKLSKESPLDFLIIKKNWISISAKGYEPSPKIVMSGDLSKQQEGIILDYIDKYDLKSYPLIVKI